MKRGFLSRIRNWKNDYSACSFTNFFLVTFWQTLLSVSKTEEITYAIYQGLSKISSCQDMIVQGICRKSESPSLSTKVITWLEPAMQSKSHFLVSGQQKTRDLHSGPGGRGQLRLRSYASAHPMILAIMTSLLRRPVKLQWPLKSDTRKVFHPMIAQRVWKKAINRPQE